MTPLVPTRRSVLATFLRSFLIQGSWNFGTMIGTGFAFALLPALKSIFREDRSALEAALARHAEHFNAHPYLANVALGAAARLEAEGTEPDMVRRFKAALRGPLGALGDALVWAAWLPFVSMASLALYWGGAPGWAAAGFFLVLYNAGHVGLRVWGFRVGLRAGRGVGRVLAEAALPEWSARIRIAGVVALGALGGVILAGPRGLAESDHIWAALAVGGFGMGLMAGHRVWRPTAVAVVAAIVALSSWGIIG